MENKNSDTIQQLLARVAEGDQPAFQQLIFLYSERIFFHALTFVKSWPAAEELVQDIFMRIWQKRDRLRSIGDWENYLFILSRNLLINAIQKKRELLEEGHFDQLEDLMMRPDEQYANKDLGALLQKAIDQLPLQKRQVFTMVHQQGLSQHQVAESLGIATRTVRWNLVAATNEIRQFLHKYALKLIGWWLIFHL